MTNTTTKIKLGISIGDLNGIGMEVILKTFKDSRMMEFCTPVIFGSTKIASYHRKLLNFENFNFNIINSIKDVNHKKANLINLWKDNIEMSNSDTITSDTTRSSGMWAIRDFQFSTFEVFDFQLFHQTKIKARIQYIN